MEPLKPPALQKGDLIGIISPSSHISKEKITPSIDWLEAQGFQTFYHPQNEKKFGQFAGTTEERADALHDMFSNPDIKAIFCAVGGNGCIHLLDQIDYDLIQANPKIFMGFSDTTPLLNVITAKTGLITFHGPTLTKLYKINETWKNQTLFMLAGAENISVEMPALKYIQGTSCEGRLYGGNLSALQTLIGTDYAPDLTDAVLFIEDINDHLSRYDRMLGHMKQAGWFNDLAGILSGQFLNPLDNPERPFGFSIEECLQRIGNENTPIMVDAPFGHGEDLPTFPIGCRVKLEGTTLTLLESPVS